MKNDEFNDLPEFEKPAEEKSRKKGGGFWPRLFGGGKDKLASAAKGGRIAKGGVGRNVAAGLKGGASKGTGLFGIGRGASFGAGRAGGIFGRGLSGLLGSKAGLLGLLLGSAAIIAGGVALYNMANGPSGAFKSAGLFQGSFYNEISGDGSEGLSSADPDDALNANYFDVGAKGADDDLGEAQNPEESDASYEEGLASEDADEAAEAVASAAKPRLAQVGALDLGGGSGGAAGGAFGNSRAFGKSKKAKTTAGPKYSQPGRASTARQKARTVWSLLDQARDQKIGERVGQGAIAAYDLNKKAAEKPTLTSKGGPGMEAGKGVEIGPGTPNQEATPTTASGQAPPLQDTNLDEDENEDNEDATPKEVLAMERKINEYFFASFLLMGLALGAKLWGGSIDKANKAITAANKAAFVTTPVPGAVPMPIKPIKPLNKVGLAKALKIAKFILAGISVALAAKAMAVFYHMKNEYPDLIKNTQTTRVWILMGGVVAGNALVLLKGLMPPFVPGIISVGGMAETGTKLLDKTKEIADANQVKTETEGYNAEEKEKYYREYLKNGKKPDVT